MLKRVRKRLVFLLLKRGPDSEKLYQLSSRAARRNYYVYTLNSSTFIRNLRGREIEFKPAALHLG